MRKVIAAINMTLDAFCDHTAMIADEEIHDHYNDLLRNADTLIYGRITYQLMEDYWPSVVKHPIGIKASDEFAVLIDNIQKIVFSNTLKTLDWKTAKLAQHGLTEEVIALKNSAKGDNKTILVGSPGLIISLMNLHLLDELQLCVHPVMAGNGMLLFNNIKNRTELSLQKIKEFKCGAVIFYYQMQNK